MTFIITRSGEDKLWKKTDRKKIINLGQCR